MQPMSLDRSLAFTVLLDLNASPTTERITALVDAWLAQESELHFWKFGCKWIEANPA